MTRTQQFAALDGTFDVLIIGGGATGLGIAVDAVTRGYRTALVEAGDFAQATSSRATKLVHGGVRYLASGQIHLVYEALHERKVMITNAPHLVHPLAFITPAYKWGDLPFYGSGLKLYDLLSGTASLGRTRILSAKETRQFQPGIAVAGLKGSILYYDGQFDDARLALALARTAQDHGALVCNYTRCLKLTKQQDTIDGAVVRDMESGQECTVKARVVINAAGIFSDEIRHQDNASLPNLLTTSRGSHIVVPGYVLGSPNAIMVPRTKDGRIIFAIPWLGQVVIGTTDLPAPTAEMEPGHLAPEIDFLIDTINPYLAQPISRRDVLSVFSGLRPLVTGKAGTTSKLSREHHIDRSTSGLITVAGGKWTTYRRMAQDTLDFAIKHKMLQSRKCSTATLRLHGAPAIAQQNSPFAPYGADAPALQAIVDADPSAATLLDEELPYIVAQVIFAVREELARTVEDVLSRRTRALLLNARAAQRAAAPVAGIMAQLLGYDAAWIEQQVRAFQTLAQSFYTATPA